MVVARRPAIAGTRESRIRLFTEILACCQASYQPKAVANTRSCR
jgi:hypothetical protein